MAVELMNPIVEFLVESLLEALFEETTKFPFSRFLVAAVLENNAQPKIKVLDSKRDHLNQTVDCLRELDASSKFRSIGHRLLDSRLFFGCSKELERSWWR